MVRLKVVNLLHSSVIGMIMYVRARAAADVCTMMLCYRAMCM